jgi:hypothetical protein
MIKECIGMRQVFKVWNFLMVGWAALALVIALLAALGVTAATGSGLGFLGILLLLIPLGFTFVMARAGIRGDYDTSTKLGCIILVLDIINFIANGTSALVSLFFAAAYVYMSMSLNKYH